MSPETIRSGLSFKTVDFHIHTPASKCFVGDCSPVDIVDAAIASGLHAIAITDHNSAEWVDRVKAAAEGKPLVVFPGAEISCAGGKKCIHVLALLDPQLQGKMSRRFSILLASAPSTTVARKPSPLNPSSRSFK